MKWPIHSFTDKIRHPKEGHFNSHHVNPRFPLSAPSQWWPTLNQCFSGFNMTKGEYKAFCTGGVLSNWRTLEWKLRMKVCFHHKFVVNEWMESTIKLTHPIYVRYPTTNADLMMYCLRVSPIELIDPLKVQQSYNCGLWATKKSCSLGWNHQATSMLISSHRQCLTWRSTHQEKNNRVNEMELRNP